jgi:hypothetical protein
MIFAWTFLVVISIFIARYSRSLWKGLKICGNDAWFQVFICLTYFICYFFCFVCRRCFPQVHAGVESVNSRLIVTL